MDKKYLFIVAFCLLVSTCKSQNVANSNNGNKNGDEGNSSSAERTYYSVDEFVMGVDLSYANQILDHGGTYRDSGAVESPYKIMSDYGANVIRLRLWHNPDWVRDEVYKDQNVPLYSGLVDVTESIQKAKENGMAVNLDFHYSDIWADPGTQEIPEAWQEITDLEVLKDSVYKYTKNTLQSLNDKELMPEFVQVGNETNCGMMFTDAPDEFPALNVCDGNWQNAAEIYKSGSSGSRGVSQFKY
jgi:arabinogalactan endo-1,4-beta-galactosidase